MKRREPSNEEPEKGLRAQLTRAVGGLRSVLPKGQKSVDISKQRLSAVLWNDRTMRANAEMHDRAAEQAAAERELEHEAVLLDPEPEPEPISGVTKAPPPLPAAKPLPAATALPGAAALAAAVANTKPRARIDTPQYTETMRAHLLAADARVAAKVPATLTMPKGIAPPITAAIPSRRPEPKGELDWLVSLEPPPPAANPAVPVVLAPAPQRATPAPQRATAAPPPPPPPITARSTTKPPPLPAATRKASPPPPRAAVDENEHDDDEEPILTRSMARLLAGQGHRDRALRIYDALIAAGDSDESLRAEADALRRAG